MPEYKLEIKQIVEYPRCRIYRQFIRTLMTDRSIRVSGGSGLFYFTVLCSYANFRTSYKRIGGINYTIYPGEWICRIDEITKWFRVRFQRQAISILETLQDKKLITYTLLSRGHIVKFKIKGWQHFNTILDYNAPCQKDTGFFFMSISKASEIIGAERCSEMDIVLDLWINTIYNDEQVEGSEIGPVVYMRNGTGSPLISYSDLALGGGGGGGGGGRWGLSKATVGRILKKLEEQEYLSLLKFPGRNGSVICLKNYLSTMFQVSDVMIDKEEIAMSLNINISVPENTDVESPEIEQTKITPCVSNANSSVSKPYMKIVVEKVLEMLATQGISCSECPQFQYKLSPLSSDCKDMVYSKSINKSSIIPEEERFIFEIHCGNGNKAYMFELTLIPYPKYTLEEDLT